MCGACRPGPAVMEISRRAGYNFFRGNRTAVRGSLKRLIKPPTGLALLVACSAAACTDGFTGSNVQFDFGTATFVQVSPGKTVMAADEIPNNTHYTLYGIDEADDGSALFEVARFEIHRVVDLGSPCFIDVGDHVPHPGLHVSQYAMQIGIDTGVPDITNPPETASEQQKIEAATAVERQQNVAKLASESGPKAVTSASVGSYPPVAPDCNGEAGMIPPPTCTDDASNALRLELCTNTWLADPDLFEGTDRVLTSPLNGKTFGFVDGANPIDAAPLGGAQIFVPDALGGLDSFAVYWQFDDTNGDGNPDFPNPPPADTSQTGTLVFFGKPMMPTRGVLHVHMTSPLSPTLIAEMAIFADLGDDNVQF